MQNLLNQWIVPPGKFKATLVAVKKPNENSVRLVFNIGDGKKTAKNYFTEKPHWLRNDLCSWLGRDRLQKLAVKGSVNIEQLNELIGEECVLVVTNEKHGQEVPLVVISEILPNTPENLSGGNTSGPSFRMLFPSEKDDSAIAA